MDVTLWGWKTQPTTDADFEAMMASLDEFLARNEVLPHQRGFTGRMLVAQLLQPSATSLVAFLGPGTDEANPILARVSTWFRSVYEKRFNPHFDARSFAFDLRGTMWRMRIGVVYGSVCLFLDPDWNNTGGQSIENSLNLIHGIENFTPAAAQHLTLAEVDAISEAIATGIPALTALDELSGHVMFDLARLDYAHSLDALISGIAWNKACWDTAQAAEKLMKGLLALDNQPFPRGQDGHKMEKVGKVFGDHFGVILPTDLLKAIDCHPDVRYGERGAAREDALYAHVALLRLIPLLVNAYTKRVPQQPSSP